MRRQLVHKPVGMSNEQLKQIMTCTKLAPSTAPGTKLAVALRYLLLLATSTLNITAFKP